MPKAPTARERAREELTREIKVEARRQLATHGAEGLSLRAVARELGMVSSALYRYYPSRDELLTALILDAYNAVAEQVEQAVAKRRTGDFLGRWRAACNAVREWGLANPQEYALIYGSPVVGYRAPRDTAAPAARVPVVLLRIVQDSHQAGKLADAPNRPALSPAAARQVDLIVEAVEDLDLDLRPVPRANLAAVVIAWTQLYGMVSFELFGHLEGVIDDKQVMFEHATNQLAHLVGLRR
ncbi:MAG TPA: TetR/AcrR family transcriptional regulator [Kribbellaceae bacterium]|nr:TetR/AcrR family transcriptional regulator [Kribbellaceae bacterium]